MYSMHVQHITRDDERNLHTEHSKHDRATKMYNVQSDLCINVH